MTSYSDLPVTISDNYFFEFWTDFSTFLMHLQIWSRIQRIRLTWAPPRLHMAAIYRCIYSLGDFRKSLDTFWTCSDLPVTISGNFNFSSFKLIFTDSSTFIEVDIFFEATIRTKKFQMLKRRSLFWKKKFTALTIKSFLFNLTFVHWFWKKFYGGVRSYPQYYFTSSRILRVN